jgi:estrogen-related receptor beta like 1
MNQDVLANVSERYKLTEKNISNLTNELQKITQELDELKVTVDTMGKKVSDVTPLQDIKEALTRIRGEIRQMDLRTGVLQNSLLHYKIKKSRALSAKGQKNAHQQKTKKHKAAAGYEFDPFNVHTNNIDAEYD